MAKRSDRVSFKTLFASFVEGEVHVEDSTFNAEPEAEESEQEIDEVHCPGLHHNKSKLDFCIQIAFCELICNVTYPHVAANYCKNVHDDASEEIDHHLEEKAESSTGRLCCNHDPNEWEDRDASPDDVSNFVSDIAFKRLLHLLPLSICHSVPLEGHSARRIVVKIGAVDLLIAILDTFAEVKICNCS